MAVAEQTWQSYQAAGLAEIDPTVAGLVDKELGRQRDQLELIASENFTWPAVLQAVGSVLTNKYAEGYPGRRYYGGCEWVDEVEQLAIDRAKELFGADHANVQPHAGAPANQAAYFALLEHGDPVLGLRLDHGGHLTHGLKVNFSGRNYDVHAYGVRREDAADRLRRGAAAGAGAAAQADRRGRLGVPAGDRRRRVPRDRRRGRRAVDGRHGALRRASSPPACTPTRSSRPTSSPRRPTRRWPARASGLVLCRAEHATGDRQGGVPGPAGRAAVPRHRGQGGVLQAGRARDAFRAYQQQIVANADGAGRDADRRRHRAGHRRHRHPSAAARPAQHPVVGQGRRGAAARGRPSPSTATRCRSTSGRRRSPRACASARRPRRCAASTRTTCARSGAIILETLDPAADLPALSRAHAASCWPAGRSTPACVARLPGV